ncbi:serine hydrolase domain-containing protein [Niveispirillum irakense]|uniref:serine hydrolase domain-containing protein n=1 Tax=Niveispirillum irakense TaxID=34011 RepID=UPI0003FC986C|nr:serine hydrolase domain-containing protein [Niveispirillum irakense]
MRRVSILLTSFIALTGAAWAGPEADKTYQERLSILTGALAGGSLDALYQPREKVAGAGASALPVATPAQRSIKQEALDAARAYAEASKAEAFIVWHDGRIQDEAYFNGAAADTPLASKSLSKPMTAMVIGRAIQMGHIKSLDQSVADYITEWQGTPKAAMKLRHLLDMRTGFLEQGFSPDPASPWNLAYLSSDHGTYIIQDYPLTHEPGTRYGYSNATSELIAVVIERATGRRYAEFVGTELLSPVGAPGGEVWINRPEGLAHSGCCMMLPARSWLHMARLLLDDGVVNGKRLLPEGYVQEMATATAQNPHYGLGLWVAGPYQDRRGFGAPGAPGPQVLHSQPYLDKDLFMFDGNGNQTVQISRAAGLIVLRMGPNPPKDVDWDNSRLPNLLLGGLKQPVKLTAQAR